MTALASLCVIPRLLLVLVGCLIASPAEAATINPDRALEETRRFTLETTRSGQYRLSEEHLISYTMLTERATRQQEYVVYEPFYAPVDGLRASVGGRRLRTGDIREVQAEHRDLFLSGGRYHILTMPVTPDVGDRIEYEVERTYSDVAYSPLIYIPSGDRLDRFQIEIEHPPQVDVGFHFSFPRAPIDATIDEHRPGLTVLTVGRLDPLPDLPLFAFNGFHAVIQLAFTSPDGAINPVSADDFGGWYTDLAQATVQQADPGQLAALAQTLEQDSPRATVSAIHDYVRSTIRYIADERGINAFVPRAPDTVLERGYGDCKDRAFLVEALAEQLGLDVDIVLVSTEPEPAFEGTHVGLYNHVINAFEEEPGRFVYFDPTHRYMPYGSLPESDAEGPALHMTDGVATLLAVPAPPSAPEIEAHVETQLDGTGQARLSVRGNVLAVMRHYQEQGGALDVENVLRSMLADTFYKVRFFDFQVVEDRGAHVELAASVDLSEFIIASPTRRYIPVTAFTTVSAESLERESDDFALHLPSRSNIALTVEVTAPGWEPRAATYELGSESAPVHFTGWLEPTEEGARLSYRFIQSRKRLEGPDRTAYLDAARSYLDARRDVFIFDPRPVTETTGH